MYIYKEVRLKVTDFHGSDEFPISGFTEIDIFWIPTVFESPTCIESPYTNKADRVESPIVVFTQMNTVDIVCDYE